jgi:hypothetical protein
MLPTIMKFAWCNCASTSTFEAKPENLIGDLAYDSDPLDEELRRDRNDRTDARSATAKSLHATMAR